VDAVCKFSPDVVVTDISMPKMDGIDAARMLLRTNPRSRVILLTAHIDLNLVRESMLAGCSGYVLKSSAGEELLPAITAALQGGSFISAELGPAEVLDELKLSCARMAEYHVLGDKV
jgi:DNA-binding NarL/FixJ family response regulator